MNKCFQTSLSIILLSCFTLIVHSNIQGQTAKRVYVEAGGEAFLYSVNYDMRLTDRPEKNGIGIRVGVAVFEDILIAPLQVNYLLGKNGKYFEIGAGGTIWTGVTDFGDGTTGFEFVPTAGLRYRSQPLDGGFTWSFGVATLTRFFFAMPSLSIGYAF